MSIVNDIEYDCIIFFIFIYKYIFNFYFKFRITYCVYYIVMKENGVRRVPEIWYVYNIMSAHQIAIYAKLQMKLELELLLFLLLFFIKRWLAN